MAKGKNRKDTEMQFIKTAANLKRKGKTNKKLKRNPKAAKYN